jgi:hypothetical protein
VRVFDYLEVALKLLPEYFSQLCFLFGSEEKFCGIRYRWLERRAGLLGRSHRANEQAKREKEGAPRYGFSLLRNVAWRLTPVL